MPKSLQSVERAAAMLQLLASEDEPLGLMQVATALGLPKGTVHRLVGTRLPFHADALGKVLLAFDPGATRSLAGKPLISLTHRTITNRVAMQRVLALVRNRGWTADVEEQNRAAQASPHRSETTAAIDPAWREADLSRWQHAVTLARRWGELTTAPVDGTPDLSAAVACAARDGAVASPATAPGSEIRISATMSSRVESTKP